MRRLSAARAACAVLLALTTVGCSFPSDYFGTRAIDYNRQAEDATLSTMLLNIVRASQRRPMQFTGLQSVTGTSSTTAGISGGDTVAHTTPYIGQFGLTPPSSSTLLARTVTGTIGGTASISGGPTFTVPVLDTQEFYQGILTPIALQTIDFYMQEGFPPELLFQLFVSKIVVTRIDHRGSCQQFTFTNSVADDLQIGQFDAIVDYLIGAGLGAERISNNKEFSPAIPLPGKKDAASAIDAFAHASEAGLEVKSDKNKRTFRLEKKTSEMRTCFAYHGGGFPDWFGSNVNKSIFCGNFERPKETGGKQDGAKCAPKGAEGEAGHGQSELSGIELSDLLLDRIKKVQDSLSVEDKSKTAYTDLFPVPEFRHARVSLKLYSRSTEGILYYLGEIVRRQLHPELERGVRLVQFKSPMRYGTYPKEDCAGQPGPIASMEWLSPSHRRARVRPLPTNCQNLFVVQENAPTGKNVASVMYDGVFYSVPHDSEIGGRSSQVMELVKQVLNLNTSAKQLPSTTVISVVGAQ